MSAARCRRVSQPVRWIGHPVNSITGVMTASCSQWFSNQDGTQSALNNESAITANSTGAVSTAPTTTRRVRSAISARRSAASTASASAAALSLGPATGGSATAGCDPGR